MRTVIVAIVALLVSRNALAAPVRVMALGDSITRGDPFSPAGGYRTKLWQDFGGDFRRLTMLGSLEDGPGMLRDRRHEGHSGYMIDGILGGVSTWLGPNVNPDFILLMIGTNDMNLNFKVDLAPGRLDQLVSRISDRSSGLKPSARLVVASIPPINDARNRFRSSPSDFSANARVRAFNAAIPAIVAAHRARGENVYFRDMNALFALSDIPDGLHPSAAAYDRLGDAWAAAILQIPEPPTGQLAFAVVAAAASLRRICPRRLPASSLYPKTAPKKEPS